MNATVIQHKLNPKLEVSVYSGHFATRHSHNSHYIDITRMKHEHTMAREAAMMLAQRYAYEKGVDTVVCLDGSEVIGAFLARHLAKNDIFGVNNNKNINVVTPEYDSNGQLIFRDNLTPMIVDKDVLILISTVNSGKTARRSLECVEYYGGKVQGIASVFSAMESVDRIPVYSLFTPEDIPEYGTHDPKQCPLCAAGEKIDALSNSYGFSLV
ncbi:MAG: phosphoribosyltransferase [Lawsonibacter sp.]